MRAWCTSTPLGVPPHVVREIAGHNDIKVTMTVYARGRLDEKAAALTQLGRAVAGALPPPVAVTDAEKDQPLPSGRWTAGSGGI
jgi:hypothetical protein